jgi:hypothetical protein
VHLLDSIEKANEKELTMKNTLSFNDEKLNKKSYNLKKEFRKITGQLKGVLKLSNAPIDSKYTHDLFLKRWHWT